jgi:predicted aminopeptidase
MESLKPHLLIPILAIAAVIAAAGILSGCYTVKQGTALLGYLGRAVPLERMPVESDSDREFIRLVFDIRRFAFDDIGLKASQNYTRYVAIDRDYLAAVVSASAKDSFARHEWRFPIVGSLPYKGFFNIEDARKEARKLESRGLDVWIRGVDAFSTLGWFKDPLYSYMKNYSPYRLAELIIHEQLHATVFIKGQVQFNEELAEFVGREGARLYIKSRYGTDSGEYMTISETDGDYMAYVSFLQELIAELEVLYSRDIDTQTKLAEKERIIALAKERFDAEYESRFSSDRFRGFSELPVNNAYLELYRLYHDADRYFDVLYEKAHCTLREFVNAAKTIAKRGDPRTQLEQALGI